MSDYINPDVLWLILKFLPLKNVLQCRSVCKSCKETIDSSSFMAENLAHQKPRLVAQNNPSQYLIIDPHALPNFETLRCPIESHGDEDLIFDDEVVCSVLGVICFKFNTVLYLWNPLIHRLAAVPQPDPPSSLCYKPCGFWIDPSTAYISNVSKIVIYCPKQKAISVFSSGNRSWTEVARDVEIGWRDRTFRQVLINGVGHWLAYVGVPFCGVIAYFDFVQERFGTIDLPKEFANEGDVINVWKWQESLSILRWWGYECNVWSMQSGSWSKVFTCDLVCHNVRDVLCVDQSGCWVLAQATDGSLALYDSSGGRVRLHSDFIGWARFVVAYEYVQSFVFPALDSVQA